MAFKTTVALTGVDPQADAETALEPLRHHEVTYFKVDHSPEDLRGFYNAFVEAVGTPVDIAEDYATGGAPTGERWAEIQFRDDVPDDVAFRHSKNAQPLHTDESYVSSPAGIMLFYCVNAAEAGGETYYISGRELVRHLSEVDPELLDQLMTVDVTYAKAGDFKCRPIIAVDADGDVDLNFNYYCADPDQDEDALKLNQRFFDFLQNDLPDDLVFPVGLQPGEAVAWRDDRVLHGRRAFTATKTGDRLIWKTGIVLDGAAA
jgi:alpha-ketoglutarate-dependent taurine dioxygenase